MNEYPQLPFAAVIKYDCIHTAAAHLSHESFEAA